jgi:hypothetical protein
MAKGKGKIVKRRHKGGGKAPKQLQGKRSK